MDINKNCKRYSLRNEDIFIDDPRILYLNNNYLKFFQI